MHTDDTYILGTLTTGERVPLLQADRRRHMAVFGQTGTGKTAFLLNLMLADLRAGAGFCFLDPHGDAAKEIAALTPRERTRDVIYLDPSDPTHAFGFNPLANIAEAERATAAANIVSAFKNIWAHSWGARLEYVFTNSVRLLLDVPDQTLLGLPRLLTDSQYRDWLVWRCRDPVIRANWRDEFDGYTDRQRAEAISPIQNKVGAFLSNPFTRSILCQTSSTLDIPRVMNEGRVLIVNLSKGNLGTEPAQLLGALLVTAIAQAAEQRRNIPEHERKDFALVCDEFQNFATDSFATILSESRKWRLSLVAATQHVAQLPEELQAGVFGNVGTLVAFRVGAQDAPTIAAELGLPNHKTLRETSNYHAWVRLMRHGTPVEPRLIATLPPPLVIGDNFERVVKHAHARHTRPRVLVDARINAFFPKAPKKRLRHAKRRRNVDAK
jgi:type IV secretory pathway TraG/TraD family ATPase VirD4